MHLLISLYCLFPYRLFQLDISNLLRTTLKYVFRITILQFFTERFLRIWDRRWSFKKTISHKENQVNLAPNYVTMD